LGSQANGGKSGESKNRGVPGGGGHIQRNLLSWRFRFEGMWYFEDSDGSKAVAMMGAIALPWPLSRKSKLELPCRRQLQEFNIVAMELLVMLLVLCSVCQC